MRFRNLIFILLAAFSWCGANSARASDLRSRLFTSDEALSTAQVEVVSTPVTSLDASAVPEPVLQSRKPLSRGNAMLRSLLIPGWGESYLGYHGTARAFFWADVALWATVIGLETYSNWREDQFLSYAADHAGAQMEGKSEGFYADIGNYMNTAAYNEAQLRDRDFEALYTDPADLWAWDSDQNRRDYDHWRILSRSAQNKIYFVIGAAALNRLISVIDTGKKANDLLKKKTSTRWGFHIEPNPNDSEPSYRVVLTANLNP